MTGVDTALSQSTSSDDTEKSGFPQLDLDLEDCLEKYISELNDEDGDALSCSTHSANHADELIETAAESFLLDGHDNDETFEQLVSQVKEEDLFEDFCYDLNDDFLITSKNTSTIIPSGDKTECANTKMVEGRLVLESIDSADAKILEAILEDSNVKASDCASSAIISSPPSSSASPKQPKFRLFHEKNWSLRYEELLEFRKQKGHAAVPHTYPPNPQLARWVKRQRNEYKLRKDGKSSTMTGERIEMLESIGFIWDSHDANWREKFEALEIYLKEHGNCNVPYNYKDKKLATWVKCQRRHYKLFCDGRPSAMNRQRIEVLDSVNFEWEMKSSSRNGTKSCVKKYGVKKGGCNTAAQKKKPLKNLGKSKTSPLSGAKN